MNCLRRELHLKVHELKPRCSFVKVIFRLKTKNILIKIIFAKQGFSQCNIIDVAIH